MKEEIQEEMDEAMGKEIDDQGQAQGAKKGGWNVGPNYKKGRRLKLFRLLMYAGILPTHALALINDSELYLKRKAYFMTNEGTLVKERVAGEFVYRIRRMPKDADLVELMDACPKTYDFYDKTSEWMIKRIKGRTWEGDEKRMYRNAETILFCDRLPVRYLLEEKSTLREMFSGNEYYTSQELLADSSGEFDRNNYEVDLNKEFVFPIGGSRNSGALFTNGGVYAIYNFSKWNMEFRGKTETSLLDYLRNIANARGMDKPKMAALFLYRTDKVLRELANPTVKYAKSVKRITEVYDDVYALPLTTEGQMLASYMCNPSWRESMNRIFRIENARDGDDVNTDYLYRVDGISRDGDGTIRYVILFAVPDIKKLTRLIDTIENATDRSKFIVRCFDFQEGFIKSFMPEGVLIQTAAFDKFLEYVNHLQEKGE